MKFKYNPPSVIKNLFNGFKWNTSSNKLLLTFDDGPTKETTQNILKILSEKNIKALFFCIGNNFRNNHSLVNHILNEGHSIGNHTFNHTRLTKIGKEETFEEIASFNRLMKEKYNYNVEYFRPPYGRITISTGGILREVNMKCIMWSLLTEDYKNDFEVVKFAVKNYLKRDSIIVLHDSFKSKDIIQDSINFIVDEAEKNGFRFGEPLECLK